MYSAQSPESDATRVSSGSFDLLVRLALSTPLARHSRTYVFLHRFSDVLEPLTSAVQRQNLGCGSEAQSPSRFFAPLFPNERAKKTCRVSRCARYLSQLAVKQLLSVLKNYQEKSSLKCDNLCNSLYSVFLMYWTIFDTAGTPLQRSMLENDRYKV